KIQPTQQPRVFDTLSQVSAALEAHRIDALITDTPTAQYMASAQLKHAALVAQFPSVGEHYGLLFHLDNPLVNCVNKAIAKLKATGTLHLWQQKSLQVYLPFPPIQPCPPVALSGGPPPGSSGNPPLGSPGSPPPGLPGSPPPGSFARTGRGARLLGGGRSGT